MNEKDTKAGGWEVAPAEYLSSVLAGEAELPYADQMRTTEALEGFPGDPTSNQRALLAAAALEEAP
jgi:hypothetical protein